MTYKYTVYEDVYPRADSTHMPFGLLPGRTGVLLNKRELFMKNCMLYAAEGTVKINAQIKEYTL